MAASEGAISEKAEPQSNSSGKRDWVDVTVRLATSWVGLFTAYVAGLILALTKFGELTAALQKNGLPPWSGFLLVAALPLFALLFSTIPSIIEHRRIKRYAEIKVDPRAGYFTLRPRETEEGFERIDQAHEAVFRWINNSREPVCYLTGASGTGKSSLLAAWVIPKLRREGHVVFQLRGYEQLFEHIKERLLKPGLIWAQPPRRDLALQILLERACQHLGKRRLIIVVDQFEEFLILKDQQQQEQYQQLLSSTVIDGLTFLLVYRPEYEALIQEQPWPKMHLDTNRKVIAAFTENAAIEFLQKSGLILNPGLLRRVLREAAEIEQATVGLIRPVTINLCGLVLSRFSSGLPRKFRGGIVRGFLRESLFLPETRDVVKKLIPTLITDNVTKRPRTISEIARETRIKPLAIQACLQRLGESDRAIVRPLDEQQEMWEISHDFLVPVLDSIIARRTVSLWRHVRPWLPWMAVGILGAVAAVSPWLTNRDPRFLLTEQGWTVSQTRDGLLLNRQTPIPPESIAVLHTLPSIYRLDLSYALISDITALRGLKNLATLTLQDTQVSDITALRGLKNLKALDLKGVQVTDITALRDLKNLKTLDLSYTQVSDITALRGLKNLKTLTLQDAQVSDMTALRELKKLTSLHLNSTQVRDITGLGELKSLASLNLSSTQVRDITALGHLKNLTTLDLSGTDVADIAALRELKSLASLNLSSTQVRDITALRHLKNLTTLDLSYTQVSDMTALRELKNLASLNLSSTQVPKTSIRDLQQQLKNTDISH